MLQVTIPAETSQTVAHLLRTVKAPHGQMLAYGTRKGVATVFIIGHVSVRFFSTDANSFSNEGPTAYAASLAPGASALPDQFGKDSITCRFDCTSETGPYLNVNGYQTFEVTRVADNLLTEHKSLSDWLADEFSAQSMCDGTLYVWPRDVLFPVEKTSSLLGNAQQVMYDHHKGLLFRLIGGLKTSKLDVLTATKYGTDLNFSAPHLDKVFSLLKDKGILEIRWFGLHHFLHQNGNQVTNQAAINLTAVLAIRALNAPELEIRVTAMRGKTR